jgi:hypothetical protein
MNQRFALRAGLVLAIVVVLTGTGLAVASAGASHSGRHSTVALRQTHPHRVPAPHITVQPERKSRAKRSHMALAFDPATVRQLAVSAAAGEGDATPTNITAVRTTRGEANQIMEPGLPTSSETTDPTPVILVTMTGSFTAIGAPIPPGAAIPTGTTLTIAYDASTGQPLDSNLRSPSDSAPPPNLASAGSPVMALTNSATADRAAARQLPRQRS